MRYALLTAGLACLLLCGCSGGEGASSAPESTARATTHIQDSGDAPEQTSADDTGFTADIQIDDPPVSSELSDADQSSRAAEVSEGSESSEAGESAEKSQTTGAPVTTTAASAEPDGADTEPVETTAKINAKTTSKTTTTTQAAQTGAEQTTAATRGTTASSAATTRETNELPDDGLDWSPLVPVE